MLQAEQVVCLGKRNEEGVRRRGFILEVDC
jgi:hypothetical protein